MEIIDFGHFFYSRKYRCVYYGEPWWVSHSVLMIEVV
jgi:hypothetical protein